MGTWPQMLPQACFCLLGGSTRCCYIYSGKSFLLETLACLVGGREKREEREWRKECGWLNKALPRRLGTESRLLSLCLLGTPKKPIFNET